MFYCLAIFSFIQLVKADNIYLQINEGDSCEDEGVQGTCRRVEMCPSYSLLTRDQVADGDGCWPEGCPPKLKQCSGHTRRDNLEDWCPKILRYNAVVTLDGIIWKTGVRKSYDKCAEYAADLPYSFKFGKEAIVKKVFDKDKKCHNLEVDVEMNHKLRPPLTYRVQYPHLALIGYTRIDEHFTTPEWFCQGLIISKRFVITTELCVTFYVEFQVSYVATSFFKRPENYYQTQQIATWKQYDVKQSIPHPDSRKEELYYDIALVETKTEIQFGINELPMCLSELSSAPDFVQTDILGQAGSWNNMKVNIEKLEDKECSTLYEKWYERGIDFDLQVCYKNTNETRESCELSPGRPIYTQGSQQNMSYAFGFVSAGTCEGPMLYLRFYNFLPWIESIVWP